MAPVPQLHESARSLVSSFATATEIPTYLNLSSHMAALQARDIDISSADPAVLKSILDSTRTYQILAIWSPDLTAVVFCYFFAAMLKGSTELLVRREAVERAWARVKGKKGTDGIEVADVKARLSVPAKAACVRFPMLQYSPSTDASRREQRQPFLQPRPHNVHPFPLASLLTSATDPLSLDSTVLALQLYAWRLFVVPQTVSPAYPSVGSMLIVGISRTMQPIRIDDVEVLMVALKLLLVGYAADLIFSAFSIEFVAFFSSRRTVR